MKRILISEVVLVVLSLLFVFVTSLSPGSASSSDLRFIPEDKLKVPAANSPVPNRVSVEFRRRTSVLQLGKGFVREQSGNVPRVGNRSPPHFHRTVSHNRPSRLQQSFSVNGSLLTLGLYTAIIQVGGQPIEVILDTGSSIFAVPDVSCSACIYSGELLYDPSLSPNASVIPCDSDACTASTCASFPHESECSFEISYADQSSLSGAVGVDTVRVGGLVGFSVPVGRVLDEQGFVTGSDPSQGVIGILGLAFSDINCQPNCFSTVLDVMFSQRSLTNYVFGFCMRLDGGVWDLGFEDQRKVLAPIQRVAVYPSSTRQNEPILGYYQVPLQTILVGGSPTVPTPLAESSQAFAIADTGTTLIITPTDWFTQFVNVLISMGLASTETLINGLCTEISQQERAQYPEITFVFNSIVNASVEPAQYLIPTTNPQGQIVWCLGIRHVDSLQLFILGQVFFLNNYVVFDQQTTTVGFAPLNTTACQAPQNSLPEPSTPLAPSNPGQKPPSPGEIGAPICSCLRESEDEGNDNPLSPQERKQHLLAAFGFV